MPKILKSQLGLAPIITALIVIGILLLGVGTIYLYEQLEVGPQPEVIQLPITQPETPSDTEVNLVSKIRIPVIVLDGAPPVDFTEPDKMRLDKMKEDWRTGRRVGCGDSIAFIEKEIEPTTQPLNAIYRKLFKGDEIVAGTEYHNPITYHTKERTIGRGEDLPPWIVRPLQFDRAVIKGDVAIVYLTGDYASVGTCEPPRVEAVLKFAAKQYPWINEVKIYIDGLEAEFIHGGR